MADWTNQATALLSLERASVVVAVVIRLPRTATTTTVAKATGAGKEGFPLRIGTNATERPIYARRQCQPEYRMFVMDSVSSVVREEFRLSSNIQGTSGVYWRP